MKPHIVANMIQGRKLSNYLQECAGNCVSGLACSEPSIILNADGFIGWQ